MTEPLIPITKKQALIFTCFFVMYEFLTYIANDMIMPGMVQVVRSFHAPESAVATSLSVYILGGASLQILLGPISDSYGRRPMMILGAFLFFIFTLFIACSNSMSQFLIARFFQGMGLCFIGVIGYATIQEIFEEMDAIRLIAIMANIAILAPLLGPLIGAVVIHYTSWRYIFVAIALGALVVLWGLWRYMPEPIGQIKRNGELTPKTKFSANKVLQNYKDLFTNRAFCFGTLAAGTVGIPCIAWIALAPIIFIVEAKLTVIQYGLWQLPVFGATILGNWFLHKLTYKYQIKQIVFLGCIILVVGAVLTSLLPYLFGNAYYYLLPGTIIYFFALSVINAPLNRYCLFVTPVSKGTASALVSLCVMVVGAIGTEVANLFYKQHNNLHFGLYCNAIELIFLVFIGLTFLLKNPIVDERKPDLSVTI
ncbi:multidrug transporter MdfA [Legionella qingyii]|uniref:Multidrug transporter MdfA n=1 Tax=Legionella qingyii TaxID=2184757 RepID=A0A317U1T2_9GAMM|nr:MFS transporter [Legionella qingyii]PWY56003.1 multidrug transporter MdfA [Legionella qingyii]RUR22001.1 MFS transporter [Legionella qingyii]RUR25583.1 MFS transporter [Legionella qingyii]